MAQATQRETVMAGWLDEHYSQVMTALDTVEEYWQDQTNLMPAALQALAQAQVQTWRDLKNSLDDAYDTDD